MKEAARKRKIMHDPCGSDGALKQIKIKPAEREKRNITFHSWRHFLNTALRAAKASDPLVQRVTGHRTAQMKEHYTHFALEDFKRVMSVQERLLE